MAQPQVPSMRLPLFVGRSAELTELTRAARRSPSVTLVEGEAGVGKTRLVRELLATPAVADRAVLLGTCLPLREPFPYGPVVDALRSVHELIRPVAAELPGIVGVLRPLLPELAEWLPPEPPRSDTATERHRVFRAVRDLVAACGPTLLVVEDLHLADEATTDLLAFLASAPPPDLSLVLTYRKDEATHVLPGGGYGLLADPHNALVRLRPLDVRDVAVMAAGLLGAAEVPHEFAAEVHRRTAGIPLVVEEVLREVRDVGQRPTTLGPPVLDEVDVPVLLRDTMADRLERLGAAVAAVAHAAAVLGEPATESDLAALCGLPERRVSGAITRAVRAAVLFETGDGAYTLRHPLARQAVYLSVPGPQRKRLHVRAAELLDGREGASVVRVAHHFRAAGDIATWVRRTAAAVDRATSVGDTGVALQTLEVALDDPALPVRARNTFAVRLSRIAYHAIAHATTFERLRDVLQRGELSRAARGEVRLNLGRLMINQVGQVERGQAEIEMAIPVLRERPAVAVVGMSSLAVPHFGTRPVSFHLDWLRAAERTVAEVRDPELVAMVRANRITTMLQLADPAAWAEVPDDVPVPSSAKVRRQLAREYINIADSIAWTGHYSRAREFLAIGADLRRGGEVPFLTALAAGTALRLDAATGRTESLAADARQHMEQVGDMTFLTGEAQLALGWEAAGRGARDVAGAHFQNALAASHGNLPVTVSAIAGKAGIALSQGDLWGAAVEVDRALDLVRRKRNWVWAADLAPVAVRALLRSSRQADADVFVAEFADAVADRDAPLAAAAVVACRGVLATARNDEARALSLFAEAAKAYESLPHPHMSAQVHEWAAACAIELDDTDAVLGHLAAAASHHTGLGADREAARCHQIMRKYQDEPRRGRKSYGNALSPREREVVRLASAGMTNRQIAENLFLSPRTVEHHVSRAMRKLGLSSRAAFTDLQLEGPGSHAPTR